ncbi:MAG: 5'/3'-nucleotidase SurE [Lachnospiraceae bacterium]|nr:5'/3'-nucleotidase SurE [Lachnospiraceae bacterium]
MRKILITNDDGIYADGIVRLARAAVKFGEVWVIAPDGQRSAMSHYITLHTHIDAHEVHDFPVEGVHAYKSTGTPADCVRFGLLNFVRADAVLTGINFGYNCGTDLQYSGTAGAAFEAAVEGVHAIAFSEGAHGVHEVSDRYLEQLLGEYLEKPLERNTIWNINFPECGLKDFKGILTDRTVAHGGYYRDSYPYETLPDGGIRMTIHGEKEVRAQEGSDYRACVENYISVGVVRNLG